MPHHREAATVLHQLLDDVPMAALINGYGWTRELGDDFDLPAESSDRLRDRCAGWVNDGVMLGALDETGIFPIPLGPDAPDLDDTDDPLAWHDMEPMVPKSVRRRRRLDVIDGDPLTRRRPLPRQPPRRRCRRGHPPRVHAPGHGRSDTLVVLSCEAQARTLPWPECPNALASAARIAGEPVADLRAKVHADFRGTTTCTHLNDVLRSPGGDQRTLGRPAMTLRPRRARSALVTGASRGVGAAIAVALAEAGADVACAARSTSDAPQRTPGTLDETVARIEAAGGNALAVPTNLAKPHEVEAMVATHRRALRAARHPREQRRRHLRRRPRDPAFSATSW